MVKCTYERFYLFYFILVCCEETEIYFLGIDQITFSEIHSNVNVIILYENGKNNITTKKTQMT